MPMALILLALTLPLGAEGSSPEAYRPAPAPPDAKAAAAQNLPTAVRTILSLKCAQCHGAHLTRPKGKFGQVEDLQRVAGDPKVVVPFRPDDSKLWQLIRDDEMPPERSKAGPLTTDQKCLIRAWIEAGAPSGSEPPASVTNKSAPEKAADAGMEAAAVPFYEHFLTWLGRFHVLAVHFPIALLMVAAAGEFWWLCCGIRQPSPAVRFCVLFAAVGGVVATVLGWLHASFSEFAASSSQALVLHRWTGTAAGVLAVGVAVLSERDARRGVRSPLCRILLLVAALLVGIAGHLGGTLVYGDSFFNW
jgi:uncharacterized membrane protein